MEKKTIQYRFGERVRELRRAKNLSQEELAFRAGIHRNYLGGIERGERNPSLKNISAIARALGVDILELFRFKPAREKKPQN
jgi:transcriptional regulator with XRE-family HTH domain